MEVVWNLLLLDEDPDSESILTSMLEETYRIQKTTRINECLKLLTEKEIHLLIINDDIIKKSKTEFIGRFIDASVRTLVILTGTANNPEIIIKAINMGAVFHYIKKPWEKKNVRDIIDDALRTYARNEAKEHLIHELRGIIDEMEFLHRISQKISEKKSLPRLLNDIMESSKLLMNAEASSLLLYDPEDKKLHFQVATGEKGKSVKKYSVDVGTGIAGWVAKNKKPLLVRDCYSDPRFNPEYDKKTRFRTESMICVPLIRKKKLLGVIEVINKRGGGAFEDRDMALFETLASQCAIAIENYALTETQIEAEAMERELDTAREIQQELLPANLPDYTDIDVAANLIPAKRVGGDYYNILKIDDNQSLFFVADVTGKGIPAALIVSTIYSCLSSYLKLKQHTFDLMTLVQGMNRVLIESTTPTRFATCWFGLFKHDSKQLVSLNAGHNPPYIFRAGADQPIELHKGGLFLGGLDAPYEMESMRMKKDDVLVFFTDGVTEAWNKKEEDYGEERLIEVIQNHIDKTADALLEEIERDVSLHVGKAQQSDDLTCAVVKIL